MKKLDNRTTEIFDALLTMMAGEFMEIEHNLYMPLTMEKIGEGVRTEQGNANLYSLCHYYTQNGDLMRDPEMCFMVLDKRNGDGTDWENLLIIPYLFQQANLSIYQESVVIWDEQIKSYDPELQVHHTAFAQTWLRGIKKKGFLKLNAIGL